jgi:magnesium-transporting ATPase (P-type)
MSYVASPLSTVAPVRKFLPLRAVATGFQASSALADATVHSVTTTAEAVGTVANAGFDLATMSVHEGAKVLSSGGSRATLTRRCWHGDGRAWVEVRGLDRADGAERGRFVLDAIRGCHGVTSARLNGPLSQVVVEIDGDHSARPKLCSVVDAAEKRWDQSDGSDTEDGSIRPGALPGDGLLLATRGLTLGTKAAGLGIAVVGRALRLPRAPITVNAANALIKYQPWPRRLLEERIGARATETLSSLATTAVHVVTFSPSPMAVDLMMEAVKAAEARAHARAWVRHEPQLAAYADHPDVQRPSRTVPPPVGPAERHAKRLRFIQLIGAGLLGALTRSTNTAANAALAASPKPMRVTRESFAATLGRELADRHGALVLRPESLRGLDKVDALVIDPRVLCSVKLRVERVRGAHDDELAAAWDRAQNLLEKPGLRPGWHRVPRMPGRRSGRDGAVEALISPAHHGLASAAVAESRRCGAALVSVDVDFLGELRPAFDDVRPVGEGAVDDALAGAVADLQQAGHTVAVLSSTGAQALSWADVSLGVMDADGPPPWNADLILADLAGAWQVLHALPAARQASQRGIEISTNASALDAVWMVPAARGSRDPRGYTGPITIGSASGLATGYLLARGASRARVPQPAPAYEWHAMSVQHVGKVLPPPDTEAESKTSTAASTTGRRGSESDAQPLSTAWQFVQAVRTELSDPLTPLLALGSAATAILGSPVDGVMVGTVLIGNSILAAAQRLRAESRLNRLLAQETPPARKVATGPNGTADYTEVVAEQLQPGDVIEVRSNEVVPADARVIEADGLEADESSLTGESLSVHKQVEATPGAELADRRCMLYAGTTVVAGTSVVLVTSVGADTQTRRAAELVSDDPSAVGLKHQLSELVSRAFPVSAGGGALVGAVALLRGGTLRHALGSAIALAVAAVPEGMPLMATLAQHASARRLSKSGALVRAPRSVEALGRLDVVCFDKTGTLSENRLRVTQVHPVSGCSSHDVVSGAAHAAPPADGAPLAHATDRAIIEAAVEVTEVDGSDGASRPDAHLPFRSGRSFSASVSGAQLTVKGAPEVVLAACQDLGDDVDITVGQLAAQGLRVITVAQRRLTTQQVQSIQNNPDSIAGLCHAGLSLTGFLALADTPRPEAAQLLADLSDRGVAVRLITGDHPVTATAIAGQLGLPVSADQVITGSEWNELSRKQQETVVAERVIFSRMSPENKVQIVQTLERTGRISAMVGDGANDAAAIRAATVGIGVVAHGSDAAHTVADVVLTEGRIDKLVHAVDEGRRLWRGVQLAVSGLLGGNAGEVIFSVIGTALTGSSPLNTRQLLLMNMLTDAIPATAVAVSTPSGPVQRTGHSVDERTLWRAVAVRGTVTAAAATAAWAIAEITGRPRRASTVALIAVVCTELGQTVVDSQAPLVLLTAAGSLAAFAAMITTPGISRLLGCTPVGPLGWAQAMGPAVVATAAVAAAHRLPAGRQGSKSPPTNSVSPLDRQVDRSSQRPIRQRATAARTAAAPELATAAGR